MLIVWTNTKYAGQGDALGLNGFGVFNWSGVDPAANVIAGPYIVADLGIFVPGRINRRASAVFVPGGIDRGVFKPGAIDQEVQT